jgi:hypothetical protein
MVRCIELGRLAGIIAVIVRFQMVILQPIVDLMSPGIDCLPVPTGNAVDG